MTVRSIQSRRPTAARTIGERSTFGRSAAWILCALAGQWAALLLVDAGSRVRYQHYRLDLGFLWRDRWLWAVLAIQLIVVSLAAKRVVASGLRRPVGGFLARAVLAATVLWTASAVASREIWKYPLEASVAMLIEVTALATVIVAVSAVPSMGSRLTAFGQSLAADLHIVSPRLWNRVAIILSTLTAGVAALLSVFVYQRHPHVPDEVVYMLHARYFALGRLWLAPPPVPQAFDLDLMFGGPGRWFSPVPPGWPAILSLGAWVGTTWLVNPVLTGVNVWLVWKLMSRLYPAAVAQLATVLFCVSPWNLWVGMSYMTHTSTLTFALLAALAIAKAYDGGPIGWTGVAGMATGMVFLIRPLDGLVLATTLGSLSLGIGRRRVNVPGASLFAVSFGSVAAIMLSYNAVLTGDPFSFPITRYIDKYYWPNANAIGFGPERGLGWGFDAWPGHTPLEAVVN